jgi:pSer/pThr/pTyr-binding forkhead associated (FHA) protein
VEEEMVIGSTSCDLTLPDSQVSSRHARIFRTGGRFWVQDLSSEGTCVNGNSVQRAVLRDGDRIAIGKTELIFHLSAGLRGSLQTESGLQYDARTEASRGEGGST